MHPGSTGMQNLFIVRNPIHKPHPANTGVELALVVLTFLPLFAASRIILWIAVIGVN